MGRNSKLVPLALACATIASPAIFGATAAHATVASPAPGSARHSGFTPPPAAGLAAAATNVAVPEGFTLIPADKYTPLPVGASDLTETRSFAELAPGITLTHIVRGTTPASLSDVNTTLEGPFIVNEVTIDPKKAKGHLEVVRGQYLNDNTTVGNLVAKAGGLVGINASFFQVVASAGLNPGNSPSDLSIDNGQLIGNPDSPDGGSLTAGPVINSATNKVILNGSYTWSGTVENLSTGQSLPLTEINKTTTVPSACASLTDQTQCTVPGDLVRFTPVWGPETPTGNGVEVVLGKNGHVVSVATTRGTALKPGQTSLQATGSTAAALLSLVKGGGRLKTTLKLLDNGKPVHLTPSTQAATASWIQINDGVNDYPYPNGSDTPTSRNPLTSIATTKNGDIILFTVEGRSTFSVGMSYPEESAALLDLGAYNAVNLDGGGSTQLAADGQYATLSSDGYYTSSSGATESNGTERAVEDAIVWVP